MTLLTIAMLAGLGSGALRRATTWEEQTRQLERVESRMRSVLAAFQPADTTEAPYWAESEAVLAQLVAEAGEPLAIAGLVAQRAEEVGLGSVRVRQIQEGVAVTPEPLERGGWRAETQPTALVVEFSRDVGALLRFVSVLPVNVEVGSVSVDGAGPRLDGEIQLFARSFRGGP